MKQINLRLDDELLEAIERGRGEQKRDAFIRALLRSQLGVDSSVTKLRAQPSPSATKVVSSARAKRNVVPIPKPGKKR